MCRYLLLNLILIALTFKRSVFQSFSLHLQLFCDFYSILFELPHRQLFVQILALKLWNRPSNSPGIAGRPPGFFLASPAVLNVHSKSPDLFEILPFFFISPSKLVCDAIINIFSECDVVPVTLLRHIINTQLSYFNLRKARE